jgi:hypothetical protein
MIINAMKPPERLRVALVHFEPGLVTIDATGVGAASEPVTLKARLPYAAWAVAAANTLERWAELSTAVDVRVRRGRAGRQIRMTDGRSQILLDLTQSNSSASNQSWSKLPPTESASERMSSARMP